MDSMLGHLECPACGRTSTADRLQTLCRACASPLLAHEEGGFAALEGTATVAAAQAVAQQGWLRPQERVVLFITGSGLKYV